MYPPAAATACWMLSRALSNSRVSSSMLARRMILRLSGITKSISPPLSPSVLATIWSVWKLSLGGLGSAGGAVAAAALLGIGAAFLLLPPQPSRQSAMARAMATAAAIWW